MYADDISEYDTPAHLFAGIQKYATIIDNS